MTKQRPSLDLALLGVLRHVINNSYSNSSSNSLSHDPYRPHDDAYLTFYTIASPIIVVIGLLGNSLCIVLLRDKALQRHRSSSFFVALAAADICNLLLYVTVEWADRGLAVMLHNNKMDTSWVRWRHTNGVCQVVLYLIYVVRLLAAWILVVTSVERYFGVCRPLLQKRIFTPSNGRRILAALLVFSFLFPVWKPILSSAEPGPSGRVCGQRENSRHLHFALHVTYAFALTLLPNSLILLFSVLIARRLLGIRQHLPTPCCYNWRRSAPCNASGPVLVAPTKALVTVRRKTNGARHEVVGTQFALLLVLISSVYLLLSWPYFVCWLLHDLVWPGEAQPSLEASARGETSFSQRLRMALLLTRPLMYLTYTVNFCIYSLTGRLFRRQLAKMFRNRSPALHVQLHEPASPKEDDGEGMSGSSSSQRQGARHNVRLVDYTRAEKQRRRSTLETNLDPVRVM